MTAKKCAKKSDARAELLFCLFNLFFFDVLVTVAVAVLASFHANVAQHLVSSFWFSLIIKDVSGYLKIVRK